MTTNGHNLITLSGHNQTGNGLNNLLQAQFVQGPNNTLQMITQNGAPAQILQIQRRDHDTCEIIVQQPTSADLSENFYEEIPVVMTTTTSGNNQIQIHAHPSIQQQQLISQIQSQQSQQTQIQQTQIQHQEILQNEIHEMDDNDGQEEECDDSYEILKDEDSDEQIQESEEQLETSDPQCTQSYTQVDPEDDKELLAEFMAQQTRCEGPGRYVCNLCRKEFKHHKWLTSHMKSHSNWIKANCKKLPQCEICHKSFRGPGMLRMHLKSHEVSFCCKLVGVLLNFL